MVLIPYPDLPAAATVGPPTSCQSSTTYGRDCPFNRRSHRLSNPPLLVAGSPYFAALVASAWSTMANAWPASCFRRTAGPLISVLLLAVYGSSSRRMSSERDSPCQRWELNN